MFQIFYITAVLENLVCMPVFFILLQFMLPVRTALIALIALELVSAAACFICRFNPRTFLYRIIAFVLSVLIAYLTAGISIGAIIMAVLCLFVFTRVRSTVVFRKDISMQLSVTAIVVNIPLALIYMKVASNGVAGAVNAAVLISAVAAVIVLVLKQVDDSRKFGKNSMDISRIQSKNNQIYAGVILVLLLIVSSVGNVSSIYKFAFAVIGKIIGFVLSLFPELGSSGGGPPGMPELPDRPEGSAPPSLFDKIINVLIYIIAIAILAAGIGFLLYKLTRLIIKLIRKLVNWLKTGEQAVDTVTEFGHTDEKQSIFADNLRNFARDFYSRASGLFNRELPYMKLPDDISKVRRLFKYFSNKAQAAGISTPGSLTAKELCREAGAAAGLNEINSLMAGCYDKARYGNTPPLPEELRRLEEKLLKK